MPEKEEIMSTGRESDKFMLRLPDGMRDRIKAAAEGSGRSMNAEIVATLNEKYPAEEPSYRNLLSMTLDFLIVEGLTDKTTDDKEELLARLDNLPAELREDTAGRLTKGIIDGLKAKVDEFERSQPAPFSDD
ncbi:Arc family DNA-binding protein [Paracoccus sp. SCSIO 75233]|uniref:Arc family DNA-binding protein n=1 Tax=Paracoccus sp. SCSIO 75233 TaxID=3017782 RepID=UPI0022F0D8E9|nr:Arc family DNA-binding protein [Paracoccus sp. SCSIO 75233]WBU51877.1 Arc family DNA-binding protein [Paracoccus sp. SCSIO 75233]